MQKRDRSVLQKVKDNAFYVALGLGLVAILAVVAVYTMGQSGGRLAEDNQDVKQASEYAKTEKKTSDNAKEITKNMERELAQDDNNKTTDGYAGAPVDLEGMEESDLLNPDGEKDTIAAQDVAAGITSEKGTEKTPDTEETDAEEESREQIPVTADAGELDFNSEKTISWPVSGTVILPYSMETTVYFKTLDQYRCNPGMLISAGNGTTVKNAYLGKVTKVTSDNTYGNMVTIYLGNDYSVTYGQLDTIYVKEGDYVKAGESIGTIGNPTDSFTEEGSHLYFEMTQGETPVDPVLFME